MRCPSCGGKAVVVNVKEPTVIKYTIHRNYKCDCGFSFKSTEKILFTTLPIKIRQQYLDGGHYK